MSSVYTNFLCSSRFLYGKLFSTRAGATIHKYDSTRDGEAVREIALQHMYSLVSMDLWTPNKEHEYRAVIQPALEAPQFSSHVIRVGDKTVGFITYHTDNRWFGKYATIEHLAIETNYQRRGYGDELLMHALGKLRSENIEFVSLDITDDDPINFYRRHDFKVLRYPVLKYAFAGHMALNLRNPQGNLAVRCFDAVRIRRRFFLKYALGLLVFGGWAVAAANAENH
jgi:ribosomal protein S18 acetylase RimI-like enzyme